jgi:chromate transport protein ChrA
MKNRNPFFTIGTVGMIVISVLHIVFALVLNLPAVHTTFFALYPVFLTLMGIGFMQILKSQKKMQPIRVRVKK